MIDTHCHLNLPPLNTDLENVWQRAREQGVNQVVVIGTDIKTSKEAIAVASQYSEMFAGVGIHPENVKSDMTGWEEELASLAQKPKVVVIGECGLDYSETPLSPNVQKQLFGLHIRLAKKAGLPLSIHCRNSRGKEVPQHGLNAYRDIFDTLEHFSKDDGVVPKFILHCMSGDKSYLKHGLKLGGYISFAGNITYSSAQALRDLLKATPLDRLLLETDAPFLSPQGKRGTTNEPANVALTYAFAAETLGLHLDTLIAQIQQNAKTIFKFPEL